MSDLRNFYKTLMIKIQKKKRKILIVFDDMIADMPSNKKLGPIVTEIFAFGRKLNNYIVFISQYYFVVPKNVR